MHVVMLSPSGSFEGGEFQVSSCFEQEDHLTVAPSDQDVNANERDNAPKMDTQIFNTGSRCLPNCTVVLPNCHQYYGTILIGRLESAVLTSNCPYITVPELCEQCLHKLCVTVSSGVEILMAHFRSTSSMVYAILETEIWPV